MLESKSRCANFELLRCIAMLMVTIHHTLLHGGVLVSYGFGRKGYIFMWLINTLSFVAVNLFVLITGYFMINSDFKISRIVKLSVQIEFYSLICLIIAKFVLKQELTVEDIVRAIFPLTGGIYWFASSYAVLLALSPLLNKFICSMDKAQHLEVCILLGVLFSAIPTIFFWSKDSITGGSDFTWFIVLYFTAAYIRRYGDDTYFLNYPKNKYLIFYLVFCLLAMVSLLVFGRIGISLNEPRLAHIFYSYNTVIIYGASVSLFMFFKNLEIKNKLLSKTVLRLGSVCFGAYLCSDNPFLRKPLWDFVNLPKMVNNRNGGVMIGIILAVLVIFIGGCIVESIRKAAVSIIMTPKSMEKINIRYQKMIKKIKHIKSGSTL